MNISAVVPAAGSGKRIGAEKPYLLIKGKPILAHTLIVLQNFDFLEKIILVVNKTRTDFCQKKIVKKYKLDKVAKIAAGGTTRFDSVFNGLREVGKETDLVFIHDGVRPFLTEGVAKKVIWAAKKYKAAVVAFPSIETIKEVDKNLFVKKTLLREKIWSVQTPQVFRRDLIIKAYKQAKKNEIKPIDDSELVERISQPVKIIQGDYKNIKITFQEDLVFAQRLRV